MANVNETVGTLSKMKRELSADTLGELKGVSGKYADRLTEVAENTFMKWDLLNGTTIGRPRVLTYNQKNRIEETIMPVGFNMYVREMPTPEGTLVMFPLHTLGMTTEGQPIINPDTTGSYTVAHIPHNSCSDIYGPSNMRADLIFTVDVDNLVTVNGQNPATSQEYELFDSIVEEFERRSVGVEA